MGLIHVVTAENGTIRFPHLGIVLERVTKAFSLEVWRSPVTGLCWRQRW